MATPEFKYQPMFEHGKDTTEYYLLTKDYVSVSEFEGKPILKIEKEGLTAMANAAFHDVSFMLRRSHNEQVAKILNDPEASENDKYVALTFLRNAEVAAKGVLPFCQDTGTAIIHGEKGQQVWTGYCDEEALSLGVYKTYTENNLRYSQNAPLSMYEEVNTRCNLPAQIDLEATEGMEYNFLCVTKGGGSAIKTFLYQETKAILNPATLVPFLVEKMKTLGTAACPPYHIAFVIGGTSAEKNLLTVKLASTRFYDNLPTTGNEYGRTFSSSNYSDKLFHEYYAYPFYKGVPEGGSQALMTAYTAYNGIPCIMHPVLRNIVMKEWGLNGTLLTDGGAFRLLLSDHKRFDNDRAAAAAACIKAGITKFLDEYKDAVYEALHRKLISVEDIEKAIRRNLRISLKLGLLDHAEDNPYAAIGVTDTIAPWSKPETKALVREATLKSVVLLKNQDHLLPLDRHKIKKIAVIGQRATEVLQDWYAGKPFYTVNVLDAIREEAGNDIEVRYVKTNRMDSARTVAAWADVAIVCVGNHPTCNAGWEQAPVISEGKEAVDRQSLQLDQEDLLLQVAQTNPNTIGVLISSFPYAINRATQTVPALLHLTQCSQE